MTDKRRRRLIQTLAASGGATAFLPSQWNAPLVDAVLLPAHAVATQECIFCRFTATFSPGSDDIFVEAFIFIPGTNCGEASCRLTVGGVVIDGVNTTHQCAACNGGVLMRCRWDDEDLNGATGDAVLEASGNGSFCSENLGVVFSGSGGDTPLSNGNALCPCETL